MISVNVKWVTFEKGVSGRWEREGEREGTGYFSGGAFAGFGRECAGAANIRKDRGSRSPPRVSAARREIPDNDRSAQCISRPLPLPLPQPPPSTTPIAVTVVGSCAPCGVGASQTQRSNAKRGAIMCVKRKPLFVQVPGESGMVCR